MAADARTILTVARWPTLLALAVLTLCAMLVPWNHDEGQYVAATALVGRGLIPFRDFAYLQTPLQPLLLAPLELIMPGWLYLGSRLTNAVAVAAALFLLGRTASTLADDRRAGVVAVLLALMTDSVLFAGSVARNDALPFLMLTLGLERLYGTRLPVGNGRAFVAGLAVAAAASTKISYAFPAAAIAVQAACALRSGSRPSLALLAGCAVATLPTAILFALAPTQFMFGVFHYSVDAVAAWQELIGKAHRLSWGSRLLRILMFLAQGPLLWLGIAALWLRFRTRLERLGANPLGIALGPVVILSVAAIALPMPPFRHYMVPIVAPLILWLAQRGWPHVAPRLSRPLSPQLLLAGAIMVVTGTARTVTDAMLSPAALRPLAVEHQAHALRRLGDPADGMAAGLEPVRLIDSGLPFDARFATGPFIYRAGNLDRCKDRTLCPVTFASHHVLNANLPAMVVTGHERQTPLAFVGGLDGRLESWMLKVGYRRVAADGLTSVWKRPARGSSRAAP